MQVRTLVLALVLATASVALLPGAEATKRACVSSPSGCPGLVCVDVDGDGRYGGVECAPVDRCQFQSDCCSATGFWCPERE